MNEATSLGERVSTDAKGTAIINLYANHHYIIYASAERNTKDVHSAPVEVFVDENLKPVKLVLAKEGYGYSAKDALKRKPQR